MIRLWCLPQGEDLRDSVILTAAELMQRSIHPLRCLFLGSFPEIDETARATASARLAEFADPVSIIAQNIRLACDRRQTKRWRLSEQEIDLLRAGQTLTLRDGLGTFHVRYTRH